MGASQFHTFGNISRKLVQPRNPEKTGTEKTRPARNIFVKRAEFDVHSEMHMDWTNHLRADEFSFTVHCGAAVDGSNHQYQPCPRSGSEPGRPPIRTAPPPFLG